eukprot:569250-Pleurochrysis_carterae.AAC.1
MPSRNQIQRSKHALNCLRVLCLQVIRHRASFYEGMKSFGDSNGHKLKVHLHLMRSKSSLIDNLVVDSIDLPREGLHLLS